jgi:hypothetical protein
VPGTGGGTSVSSDISFYPDNADLTSELDFLAVDNIGPSAALDVTFDFVLPAARRGSAYYLCPQFSGPTQFDWGYTQRLDQNLPQFETKGTVSLMAKSPSLGTTTGSITITMSDDPQCGNVLYKHTYPYKVQIFHLDTTQVSLTSVEAANLATQNLTLTPADTDHAISLSVDQTAETSAGLSVQRVSDSTFSISASSQGLAPGSYSIGSVLLSWDVNKIHFTSTNRIPVTLNVDGDIVPPDAQTIAFNGNSSLSALINQANVSFKDGRTAAWSATSDQSWLQLTQSTGTGAGPIRYTIDSAKVRDMDNLTNATATVTIRSSGLRDAKFTVTLSKALPEIYSVSPDPVTAAQSQSVRLCGFGLNQIKNGTATLNIDGTPISAPVGLSNCEYRATLPALAAGPHTLSISTASGITTQAAVVSAVSRPAFSYAAIPHAGTKQSLLFDPLRSAIYSINYTDATADMSLVRFQWNGSGWQVSQTSLAAFGNIAMSPDRQTLYMTPGSSQLLAIDPATLTVKAQYDVSSYAIPNSSSITENGRLWLFDRSITNSHPLGYFDMYRSKLVGGVGFGSSPVGKPYASPDGSVMDAHGSASDRVIYRYQTAANTPLDSDSFTQLAGAPDVFKEIGYSNDGSRMLVDDNRLYDGHSMAFIGQTASVDVEEVRGGPGATARISPDGQRIYVLVRAGNATTDIAHIDVFDTTQLVAGTTMFAKVGSIAVPDQPSDCTAGCTTPTEQFAISPYGDTLFLLGNRRLVVVPVSAALSGSAQKATAAFRPAVK